MGAAGQRLAINLAGPGLKHESIQRGDWIVSGQVPGPVRKFDARVRVARSELRPLAHWMPVHVHLGAANVTGRLAILDASSLVPGDHGLVQISLDRPIGALYGDGFVLRDQSAQRTIGGGTVVDIFPPARGRAKPQRLAFLAASEHQEPLAALLRLLEAAPQGLNLTQFAQNRNLTEEESAQLLSAACIRSFATPLGVIGFSISRWSFMKNTVKEALSSIHRRNPAIVPNEQHVYREARLHLPREVTLAMTTELVQHGAVTRGSAGVRLKTHRAQFDPADLTLWKKMEPLLNENILRPPSLHEIAEKTGTDRQKAESFLVRFARLGLLIRVAENRFFSPSGLRRHAMLVEAIAAANQGSVTAAQLRDRAGIGRTLAIEVLEYFDRIKFTRRSGNQHDPLRPAQAVFGDGPEDQPV